MSRITSTQFIIGLVVIAVGVLFLLDSVGVFDTGDVFQWIPSLFILLGLWLLVKNRFRRVAGPLIMILIAVFVQLLVLDVRVGEFWPLILIAVGIVILIKSFQSRRGRSGDENGDPPNSVNVLGSERTVAPSDQDTINLDTVMGSAAQTVTSDNFRGGRASAVMGNANIDLREASIQEKPAVLELNVVMGEIKLRAPRDWNIRVDDDTVMGDTKDERATRHTEESQTDLVIKASVVMGSLKIED